jgi:hypothetical protein
MDEVREGEDIEGDESSTLVHKNSSTMRFTSPAVNRKTKTLKDLKALKEKEQYTESWANTKIEDRRIRKGLEVGIVSAKTIEALMKFLGIEPDDSKYLMDNKLNKVRIEIQGQKPNKIKKALKPNKLETVKENIVKTNIEEST